MKRHRWAGLVIAVAVVATACGTADASGPPEIRYGRDICVECNMIISEQRFAAAYRLADGTAKKFDDVGDMVIHLDRTGDEPTDTWVHDFNTEEWVEATAAYFVPTRSVASPMGHSILSFADESEAHVFAMDVGGEVISWDAVLALPTMNGLVGHHPDHAHDIVDRQEGHDHSHDDSHGDE